MDQNLNDNKMKKFDFPIIMEKYQGLKNIPHVKIADLPTPVQRLTGLEKELDFQKIFIKRDDLSNCKYGGNKCRKFEFVIADALKKKKKALITLGGIGTNHGLAQSVFCKDFNLKSYIVLVNQPLTHHCRENLLLDYCFDSNFEYAGSYFKAILRIIKIYLKNKGSYFVWPGASRPLGTIGFVNAAFELKKQIEKGLITEPDYIFVADGSTGTSAGLTLGCELANLKTKVKAVAVSMLFFAKQKSVVKLAYNTYKLLKKYDKSIPSVSKKQLSDRVDVITDFFGGEYGLPTLEGKEAIDLLKKTEDIKLDLTYTGKTFSALLAYIRLNKDLLKNSTLLFWNTLNSVNHKDKWNCVDYKELPEELHKFFDGSIPLVEDYVKSRQCEDKII